MAEFKAAVDGYPKEIFSQVVAFQDSNGDSQRLKLLSLQLPGESAGMTADFIMYEVTAIWSEDNKFIEGAKKKNFPLNAVKNLDGSYTVCYRMFAFRDCIEEGYTTFNDANIDGADDLTRVFELDEPYMYDCNHVFENIATCKDVCDNLRRNSFDLDLTEALLAFKGEDPKTLAALSKISLKYVTGHGKDPITYGQFVTHSRKLVDKIATYADKLSKTLNELTDYVGAYSSCLDSYNVYDTTCDYNNELRADHVHRHNQWVRDMHVDVIPAWTQTDATRALPYFKEFVKMYFASEIVD